MKLIIHFIKLSFLFTYQAFFYCLDKIIPSQKKTISFYVTDKTFGDNLFYFYNFLSEKNGLSTKLIVQDKTLFNTLKTKGYKVYYVKSLLGFWCYFRSEVLVIQNGDAKLFFFPLLLNPKTKFILNLWHGIPLKRLNRQVKQYQKNRSSFQYQKMSALIVCSEFERLLMASCFFMDLDNLWVTGTPRNDEMLRVEYPDDTLKEYKDKKVILYAPTWREYGNKTSFFPFDDFNETELIEFLDKHDLYLFLRGHRLEMDLLQDQYSSLIEKTNRIVLADQKKYPNIPVLLQLSAGLITDYSSIYLDYLLLNRPIIFTPYDLKEYQNYRGFLFDYETHTPGSKVFTQQDFLAELMVISSNLDTMETQRIHEQNIMHQYIDSSAKERIYKQLHEEMNWNNTSL